MAAKVEARRLVAAAAVVVAVPEAVAIGVAVAVAVTVAVAVAAAMEASTHFQVAVSWPAYTLATTGRRARWYSA